MIKFYNMCIDLIDFADMAPLPPREQRHPFLRYQGLEYSKQDIANFEERLERIHNRDTHRVYVLDFKDIPKMMRDVLYARMLMEHRDDDGVMVFTISVRRGHETYELEGVHFSSRITYREEIESPDFARYWYESERMVPVKGDLRDYWRDISIDGDFLGPPLSYTLIRDPVVILYHRLDVGSVNIPYLLARYLRRFAIGRKSRALISGGVVEEASVAPGGGDEDEEMPQAVPPPPRT
ncbi:hypothetical protein Tco_1323893 [Tanacetum coccineum]